MKILLHLLLCCLPLSCLAGDFRVCADNRGIPPYVYIGGMGMAQYLAIQATENLHLKLKLDYRPQSRCMLEAALGHYDALLVASPNPAMDDVVVFPQNALGLTDTSLAYGHYRLVAFKLKGNPAGWDGQRFSRPGKPLLYQSGVPMVKLLMNRLKVPAQASTRTPLNMLDMLRRGRADAGVIMEPLLLYELQQHGLQQRFEIIEPALLEADAYLAISKQLMASNPHLARQLWEEIRRLRNGPLWQRISTEVQNNRLPPLQVLAGETQLPAQTR